MAELRFEVGYIVKLTGTLPYSELDGGRGGGSNNLDLRLLKIIIEHHVIAVKSFTAACHT